MKQLGTFPRYTIPRKKGIPGARFPPPGPARNPSPPAPPPAYGAYRAVQFTRSRYAAILPLFPFSWTRM